MRRNPARKATTPRGARSRELRVIGGLLRGRRWRFSDREGVRPTPDRVRETLFNWLAPRIEGATVLDPFAGSGALAIEALSRGAAGAWLVDSDPEVVAGLRDQLAQFGLADRSTVERADAIAWLRRGRGTRPRFDVVFLDPPFESGFLETALDALERGDWLARDAVAYLENPARAGSPRLPAGWELLRSKAAGEVGYHLAGRASVSAPDT